MVPISVSIGNLYLLPKGAPYLYSFLASGNFCSLLITFANSLDPNQDRHNVNADLDPKHLLLR